MPALTLLAGVSVGQRFFFNVFVIFALFYFCIAIFFSFNIRRRN